MLHLLTMVILQLGSAVMNIILKLAMDSGMNPFVHVAYRQLFATAAIAPFAYFLERRTRPEMTPSIFFNIFLCSIFGISVNQIAYLVGLKNSTPTTACALSNLVPALTYLMAIPFGIETLTLRSEAGRAKLIGTIMCVGGAMLLSFYHGHNIGIGHWKYVDNLLSENKNGSSNNEGNFILGPFLNIISTSSLAIWSIIQCVVIAICFDHKLSDWSLRQGIRATSAVYSGIVGTALAYCLMSWCIEEKGPLYVSIFNPLQLVIVAIFSWALFQDKIYVGTVVGSALIIVGLYGVLWGKKEECQATGDLDEDETRKDEKTKEESNLKELELSSHSVIKIDHSSK